MGKGLPAIERLHAIDRLAKTWSSSMVRMNEIRKGVTRIRRSRFTEQQIVAALRQAESGTPVVEVCRKLGFTEQTFYRWKRKFAGMGVAELRRLREVEKENRRLKQLVADLTLDKQMLQEALRKNWQSRPRSEQGCSSSGSERRAWWRGGARFCY